MRKKITLSMCAMVLLGSALLGVKSSRGDDWDDGSWFRGREGVLLLARLKASLGQILSISGTPGLFQSFATPQEAAIAGGVPLFVPTYSPEAWTSITATLISDRSMTVTASFQPTNADMSDLRRAITRGTESESSTAFQVTTTASPIVQVNYQAGTDAVYFAQAPSADVFVPPSVNLPLLAQIRLLFFGVNPIAAWRYSYAIDWRSAMLAAVPSSVTSVLEYRVRGQNALMFLAAPNGQKQPSSTLLWSAHGQLFGLTGNTGPEALLAIARSID